MYAIRSYYGDFGQDVCQGEGGVFQNVGKGEHRKILVGKPVPDTRITSYNVCYTKLLRFNMLPLMRLEYG